MGMNGLLFALSEKRKALLADEPELLLDVIEQRHRERIPGLLDLDKAWHALDLLLAADGDELLSDAILARTGKKFGPEISFGKGRLLPPARVTKIAGALEKLADNIIEDRYEGLRGQEVHGGYGPKGEGPAEYAAELEELGDDEERGEKDELTTRLESLRGFYRDASKRGDSVLSIVV